MAIVVGQNLRIFKDLGDAGVSTTIDFSIANIVLINLDITACVLTIQGLKAGQFAELWIKQGGVGLKTVVWPVTDISWGTDGVPTLSTTAGKIDIFEFRHDGTNLYPKFTGKGY